MVDQVSEFYNNSFKDFLKVNNNEMYSTYNEGKSVVAEGFNRALKNKIFKHMTAISKNVYFDVLDDIVNKYNKTVNRTIKIKPIDVTSDSYAEYNDTRFNPANICLDEDVFRLPLQRTSSRRLYQDEYVRLSLTSSGDVFQDVFKTSCSRPIYSSWPYVFKKSSRRFQDLLKTSCKNVFKTS